MSRSRIRCFLFDFGGVLAEEGFEQGLKEIARRSGLDPLIFFTVAADLVYSSGYVHGRTGEENFWRAVREATGIRGTDRELTGEILSRFIVRDRMIEIVTGLRSKGYGTAILSDQSDWLDRLEEKYHFFQHFDKVFNSFHLGRSKRDPSLFSEIARALTLDPTEILFIDDNEGHIERARKTGMQTHHFRSVEGFETSLEEKNLLVKQK